MKRPWNLPNLPIYSLATYHNDSVNMNLCTYVSAVSMAPKRYMVAVYENTQSLNNIMTGKRAVLQLLGTENISLIRTLGFKSGLLYNKEKYLMRKNALEEWNGYKVLKSVAGLLELEKLWFKKAGDHTLFLFHVKNFRSKHANVLTLNDLREKNLIQA